MHTIKATVTAGRLEVAVPADWPDGTEVEIHPVGHARPNNDGPRTPDVTTRNLVAPDSGELCEKAE
jgi:hypothetical protein